MKREQRWDLYKADCNRTPEHPHSIYSTTLRAGVANVSPARLLEAPEQPQTSSVLLLLPPDTLSSVFAIPTYTLALT